MHKYGVQEDMRETCTIIHHRYTDNYPHDSSWTYSEGAQKSEQYGAY